MVNQNVYYMKDMKSESRGDYSSPDIEILQLQASLQILSGSNGLYDLDWDGEEEI